jgi:hypothetical protein
MKLCYLSSADYIQSSGHGRVDEFIFMISQITEQEYANKTRRFISLILVSGHLLSHILHSACGLRRILLH